MGNRFSRKRDAPANSGETAATEEKTAEEPAASRPAEESGTTQTPEAAETENLDVVVGEPVTPVARLPSEECISECKLVDAPAASATLNDAEPEPVAKKTPAPVQPEPQVSISKPSPPESEPAAESKPVAEAQLVPEPAPEPASEPVPEPEPTSNPEAEVEAVLEPITESVPVPVLAEALEQQTDMLTQESLPEPALSSPTLIDLAVPDVSPQPVNTPPSPAPIPDPVRADEPSDIPVTEECQDSAEAAESSTFEPGKSEETTESLEKPTEVEATENSEQLVSDVNVESVSGLLQNLELKGNDLVSDFIPSDVKIPDDTPITDISTSTELM
ncbi:cell surface glycoprotein 1-like [Toxotes jaculatrix]|uniref:cell surface glycoprotein 1-like n=1 Tax=Toxotes jaculatrix TaxID=941984 RepID=UPI001B3ABAA4|nr:cell surface glycoprotein 1-like [Toxotes jaculatrix]